MNYGAVYSGGPVAGNIDGNPSCPRVQNDAKWRRNECLTSARRDERPEPELVDDEREPLARSGSRRTASFDISPRLLLTRPQSILRKSPPALRPSSHTRRRSSPSDEPPRTLVTPPLRLSSYSPQDMATVMAIATPPRTPPWLQRPRHSEEDSPPPHGRKRSVSFSTHASVATFDSYLEEKKGSDEDDPTGWNDPDTSMTKTGAIRVVGKTLLRDAAPRTAVSKTTSCLARLAVIVGLILLHLLCLGGALVLLQLFAKKVSNAEVDGGAAGLPEGANVGTSAADASATSVPPPHLRGGGVDKTDDSAVSMMP